MIAVLRHYCKIFAHVAQTTQVTEEEYAELLLKRIDQIEATCVPKAREEQNLIDLEQEAIQQNAKLISGVTAEVVSASTPSTPQKKRRRSKSLDVWPIFAPKRAPRPLSPTPSPQSSAPSSEAGDAEESINQVLAEEDDPYNWHTEDLSLDWDQQQADAPVSFDFWLKRDG